MRNPGMLFGSVINRKSGAAMIELAIVLPVLLLLMIGTIQLGRLLSQIIWSANINYEALRTGTTLLDKPASITAMNTVFDDVMLRNYQDTGTTRIESNDLITTGLPAEITHYEDTLPPRSVITVSSGRATSIFDYLNLAFGASYAAPVLLTNFDLSETDLNNFANSDCVYHCNGNEICGGGYSSSPCSGVLIPPPIPACFGGETSVTMADGSQKPIKSVQSGDLVLAFDLENSRQVPARVVRTIKRVRPSYLLLNGVIRVTEKHRFYSSGRWIPAEKLQTGDQLLTLLGKASEISSIRAVNKNIVVYNLTVENFHNYYAGGLLVHNAKVETEVMLIE